MDFATKNLKPGAGWKPNADIAFEESLLIGTAIDDQWVWKTLTPPNHMKETMLMTPRSSSFWSAMMSDVGHKSLICTTSDGVCIIDLRSKAKQFIRFECVSDYVTTRGLWLSNDEKNVLVYQEHYDYSSIGSSSVLFMEGFLYSLDRSSGSQSLLHVWQGLDNRPTFIVPERSHKSIAFTYSTLRNKRVIRIDLASQVETTLLEPNLAVGLYRMHDDSLLVWHIDNSGIEKISKAEEKAKLATHGWNPSVSPDSRWITYFDDGRLFLRSLAGNPDEQEVISSRKSWGHATNPVKWCQCSKHFAVETEGDHSKCLLVADIIGRNYCVVDVEAQTYAWVPPIK